MRSMRPEAMRSLLYEVDLSAGEVRQWRSQISRALQMTVHEHGTREATLPEAVAEIGRLLSERDAHRRRRFF